MSLLPLLLDLERARRLNEQQFTFTINPDEYLSLFAPQYANNYLHNWKQDARSISDTSSTIKVDKNKFQVNLDVQHFAPEDITVKTADGCIIIEAKHEEKKDTHGWVARQFVRRYPLPEGCSVDAVESRLSSDGVLTVTAPLERPQTSNERAVPIIQTGPVKTRPEGIKLEGGDSGGSLVKAPVENGE